MTQIIFPAYDPKNPDHKTELSLIRNLLERLYYGAYNQKRLRPVELEIEPVGDVVTIGDQLKNAQILAVLAYDSGTAQRMGHADLLGDLDSFTGLTDSEIDYMLAAISSEIPFFTAAWLEYFLIGNEADNVVMNLKSGHTVSKVRFIFLPPELLVNP